MSGSGGIVVMDDTVDMVEAMANINAFMHRVSGHALLVVRAHFDEKDFSRMCSGDAREEDGDLLLKLPIKLKVALFVLLERLAWPTQSFVKKFRKDFLKKPKLKTQKTLCN